MLVRDLLSEQRPRGPLRGGRHFAQVQVKELFAHPPYPLNLMKVYDELQISRLREASGWRDAP